MNSLKEKIKELRIQNKTYKEIMFELGICKSTVNYHCSDSAKEQNKKRKMKFKRLNPLAIKVDAFKRRLRNQVGRFQHRIENVGEGKLKEYSASNLTFHWKDVFELVKTNPKCYLTGDSLDIEEINGIALDHKIPVSKGGNNSLENLGICSSQANRCKTDQTVDEHIEYCKKVLTNFGYKIENSAVL